MLGDLVMPGRTGIDLYDEVERESPELASRVYFMTGGAFTPEAEAFVSTHHERVLSKPITHESLEHTLRSVSRRDAALDRA